MPTNEEDQRRKETYLGAFILIILMGLFFIYLLMVSGRIERLERNSDEMHRELLEMIDEMRKAETKMLKSHFFYKHYGD